MFKRILLAVAFIAFPSIVCAQTADWTAVSGVKTTTLDVVGIGTTSPNYRLHVFGDTTNYGILSDVPPGGYGAFGARLLGKTYGWYWIPVANGSYTDLYLGGWDAQAGNIRWMVKSDGSIGIGTTAPDAKLHIFGDGGNAFKVTTVNSTYPLLLHDTLSSEGYPNGIVADFQGNSLIRVSNLQLGLTGFAVVQSMGSNPLYLNRWSANDVVVGQNAYATAFRVESTGNSSFAGTLAIGTTTPGGSLHVAGDTQLDGNLTLSGGLTMSGGLTINGTSSNPLLLSATGISSTGISRSATVSGTAATYYGGGAQSGTPGFQVNGPSNGDGSPYTYGQEGGTTTMYFGGKAGGYFAGGSAVQYAGGGAGLVAIGGNALSNTNAAASGSTAHGGAGLYARGGLNADGTQTWAGWFAGDVHVTGELTGANVHAQFQDVAEWVPASEVMTAGTVVVLNASKVNEVMASFRAYDTSVAGVVSEKPGVILGSASPSKAQIATTGRVKVKVDATNHPVAVGDLLVTSDKPGMAMVSEPIDIGGVKIHRPGTLIGKALEPLPSGEGEILVLLSLQ
jgi:hypothetical protein